MLFQGRYPIFDLDMYFIKTPAWLKQWYNQMVWDIPTTERVLYLSFDDGPHPEATPFVLNELARHQAKATFFCVGKNVVQEPKIFQRILQEGHTIGNHTHNHLNGSTTGNSEYLQDVGEAAKYIDSNLFRPPYGRMSRWQATAVKKLRKNEASFHIIMWDVLSGDFDKSIHPEDCLLNVIKNVRQGSIVVFHDSAKALSNLHYTLPKALQYLGEQGFRFEAINPLVLDKQGPGWRPKPDF